MYSYRQFDAVTSFESLYMIVQPYREAPLIKAN